MNKVFSNVQEKETLILSTAKQKNEKDLIQNCKDENKDHKIIFATVSNNAFNFISDALTLLCKNEQEKPQRSSKNLSLKDISQEEKDLIEKLSESRLAVIDCIDAIDALAKNEAIGAIVRGLLNWHRIAEKTKHILIDDHGFTKEQIKKLEMQINLKRY